MSQPINRASTFQPFPCFYVYRPGYMVVPLIPLDELPGWIQVGDFNWADSALYEPMLPASFNCFPRVGEYDVICHHCYAHVDSFHRSVSERSNSNASSRASNVPKSAAAAGPSKTAVLDRPCILKHPPFEANFNTSPFVGMCFLKCKTFWSNWCSRTQDEEALNPNPPDNHSSQHSSHHSSHHSSPPSSHPSSHHSSHHNSHHSTDYGSSINTNHDSNHSTQADQEQMVSDSSPQAEESRPEEPERNAEAETPTPIEDAMPFPMSINDNDHNALGGDSTADPHPETGVQSRAVSPQSRTRTQRSVASSSYPGDGPVASHRASSSESTLGDRPRGRPGAMRTSRRRVRFEWPAGGFQPIRRTGPNSGGD
ncbi:hypothetical protein BO94DRAFT_302258 [Aspergillus sclerotioniger CBS 115572]|uniref:Uncharacterized protein n=1 Tax=Aspergillus sclerotioniger CBS 115572 TaxID=1450535 RepID=A0A317V6K6_9EURO|nr:hypothetical protein BO94DRAFT_302258 [Aspergillus sclerotioniger CBS 115572]PWY68577.1 hypothetical protein BO94DRAFT_302258 [Aspergillus sclerotioniger CBS 115572]